MDYKTLGFANKKDFEAALKAIDDMLARMGHGPTSK